MEVCFYTPELLMFLCSVLTLSILPFFFFLFFLKCQVSTAAGAPVKLSVHYGTLFSYSDEQDVHLMAQYCPFVNELGIIMPFR